MDRPIRHLKLSALAALGACVLSALTPAIAYAARSRVSLDAGWKFSLESTSELSNTSSVQKWQWVAATGSPKQDGGNYTLPSDNAQWHDAALHEDTFKGRVGYSWYRTTLPAMNAKHRVVRFAAVDDNAEVFLNGAHLIGHEGYNTPFIAGLDAAWNNNGSNVLLVLVENTGGGGGITGDVVIGNDLSAEAVQPTAPRFNDSHWRTVNVPHDYLIEQPYTPSSDDKHAFLPSPAAWYRKTVLIPKADRGKDYWLDFDGLYRDAKVYVNGKFVGEHQSGYVPMHIDVSSLARQGEPLTIAVHLDPSQSEGWWYEGGGIYRHVWLTSVDRLHVEPEGVEVVSKEIGEEPLQGTTAGAQLFQKMMDHVHRLDPTRLSTCAMNHAWGRGISLVEDIQGCNYLIESFQDFHKKFPDKPMIFTESSSAVQDRGMYINDRTQHYLGDYTNPNEDWLNWVRRTEDAWRPIAENDFLAGTFVWAGFSYKGEPFPYGWPNVSCHYGVLDTCGFPKDDYYFYKVYWGDKPALHIAPHWNWPALEGKPVKVVVFSNAPTVDLSLNGVSLGQKTCPMYGHAEWTVNYAPGTLVAKGYDASGRLMATDQVATAGKSYRIELRTDLPKGTANGEDESVVEAAIVDEQGRFVPTASDTVKFTVTGNAGLIAGTGNGDPNDHTPDPSPERRAFNGRLAAIIRSTGKHGAATVTATGIGLQPTSITIRFD